MSLTSLTHRRARHKVNEALNEALARARASSGEGGGDPEAEMSRRHMLLYLTVPPCLCSLLYLLSLTINPEPGMYPGLITTILLLMLGAGANVYVVHLLRASEEGEVRGEIESIVSDYKAFLDRAEETYCAHEQQQQQQQQAQAPSSGSSSSIASGHPHVSVVTAYRNLQWQRIPVLLLVEGDVIALMGGDITPGRAHELTQVAVPPGPGQPQGGHLWRKSGLVERGEKIFLRRGAAGASSASSSTPAPVKNPPGSGAEAELSLIHI